MKWYVLHTKPRSEKKVEEQLLSLGINAYSPTRPEIRFWSDRKKRIEVPVLPSMVLVNIDDNEINKVFFVEFVLGSFSLIFDLWTPELAIFVLKIKLSVKFPPRGLVLRSQF